MNAVIFDMDGVIINTEPLHFLTEQNMYKELGLQIPQDVHESFVGMGCLEMFCEVDARYGLNCPPKLLVAEKHRRYLELLKSVPLPLIPGVGNLVEELYRAGFSLAVASSAPREQIDYVLKESGFGDFFRHSVSGEEVPRGKPAPDIFLRAAEVLGAKPQHCRVIEDAGQGVAAAKAAGMRVIGFRNIESGDQDLSAADWTAATMAGVQSILLGGPSAG